MRDGHGAAAEVGFATGRRGGSVRGLLALALFSCAGCSQRHGSVYCLLYADEGVCEQPEEAPPEQLEDASSPVETDELPDADVDGAEDAEVLQEAQDAGGPLAPVAEWSTNDAGSNRTPDAATDAGMDSGASDAASDASMDTAVQASDAAAIGDADAAAEGGAIRVDAGTLLPPCDASAAPSVGRLGLESVVTGLTRLVYAAQAPGASDWYLVQQDGQILRRAAGAGANTVFLDLRAEFALSPGLGSDERGLLGLAFAPDYVTSGLFYVMLTPTATNQDQVRQYQRTATGVVYRDTLLVLPASSDNHNGGTLVMRDGLLYVGTGDGGGGCNSDKPGAPQQISSDPSSWFGKILRLDPTRKVSGFAAPGNPFAESPLVYHYGLRNPYRFGFDRLTGDLYVGDVGQDSFEEVSFARAGVSGLNFGWGAFEGNATTCGRSLRAGSVDTKPVFVADRRSSECTGPFCDWASVIGGVVYRGSAVPRLRGSYLAGDYLGERLVAFFQCDARSSPVTTIRKRCDPGFPSEACFENSALDLLLAIVEDNAGELYFVANGDALLKLVAR